MVKFWSALGSWHVSRLTRTFPKTDDKMCQQDISPNIISPFPRTRLSWDHSSCPEITSPKGSTISRSIPPVSSKTDAATDSLDHHIHLWRALCRTHSYFKRATTSISTQTITKISRNHSSNQEQNLSRYKEISTCKSCGYRNPQLAPAITILRVFLNWEADLRKGIKKNQSHSLLY